MPIKDLTGQKFNEITVLELDKELTQEKRRTYWRCQCSCGRIKSVRADGLKRTKTCGECRKNLIGQKFGRLLVKEKGKKDKAQHQYYICECDCGNVVEVNGDNLRRGLTQSCGCLHSEIIHKIRFKDITGQKFGKLTALNYEIINGKAYWYCQCECGNITKVVASNLKNGHTQSCGCISYSIGEQNIVNILKENNISFIKEASFKDLPRLRYDFYLTKENRLIEFDGIQHFTESTGTFGNKETLEDRQRRDQIKNEYAKKNNIPLVRIPYYERDNITLNLLLSDKYLINFKEDA